MAQARSGGEGAFMLIPCCMMTFVGLFIIAMLAFHIWVIVDIATKEPSGDQNKLIWILIAILVGPLGSVIYLIVRRPERKRLFGR